MIIGVPTEIKDDEYRVAITPAGVQELVDAGNEVLIERGAGIGSTIRDEDFVATGARIVDDADDVWAAADLVLKVKEPIAEEYPRLKARQDQVLFTYLHLAASLPCTEALVAAATRRSRTRRCACERLAAAAHPDERGGGPDGPADGRPSPHARRRRPGALICGVPGVAAANVVVLGAGVAGMAAATLAVGMQANVYIFDRNLERLRDIDHHFRGQVETVASTEHAIAEQVALADIVIGAVLVVGATRRAS